MGSRREDDRESNAMDVHVQVAECLGLQERFLAEDGLGILEEAASFCHDALRGKKWAVSAS